MRPTFTRSLFVLFSLLAACSSETPRRTTPARLDAGRADVGGRSDARAAGGSGGATPGTGGTAGTPAVDAAVSADAAAADGRDSGGPRDVAADSVSSSMRDSGSSPDVTGPRDTPPATGRKALLVLKYMDAAMTLVPGDAVMRDWLTEAGFDVQTMSQDMAQTASASAVHLVVISASSDAPKVKDKFTLVPVPVLVLETGAYGGMGLTTEQAAGFVAVTGPLMVTAGHPLAAGLSGEVEIGAGGSIGWGTPAPAATRVATLAGNAEMVQLFAYDKNAAMVTGTAPARRVAFGAAPALVAGGNANLKKLFRAAVSWLSP